jgi:gluconolactonase
VVNRKGGIYFTDPGARAEPGQPAPKTAVYYLAPNGKAVRIATDIERPNGIQLSPDEKVLYVANTSGEYILAYDVNSDGAVGPRRNFAKLAGVKPADNGGINSGADGLAVDAAGRLYVASAAGVQIFDQKGRPLGIIELPKAPQNLAFAGNDKKTLYIVGRGAAYRVNLLAAGFSGRAK